jgi:peptidylprolyl isomerase
MMRSSWLIAAAAAAWVVTGCGPQSPTAGTENTPVGEHASANAPQLDEHGHPVGSHAEDTKEEPGTFSTKPGKPTVPGAGPWAKLPAAKYKASATGLTIGIIKEGQGEPIKAGQGAAMHYTGWTLKEKAKFDSSRDRGEPFEFPLGAGRVIAGWDEGVAGMKPGEQRQLVIPSELGYGESGQGEIPPGATLIFDVELVKVL